MNPPKISLFMRPTDEKEIEKIKAMKDNKALGPIA